MATYSPEVQARFFNDTAKHEMTVVLDAGLHRHLRFGRPGTSIYHFNIVTWPGYLAITGDMGAAVFSRLPDMFQFFRASATWQAENPDDLSINPSYWSEKCDANDGEIRVFSKECLKDLVTARYEEFLADVEDEKFQEERECPDLWTAIQEQVLEAESVESAITAIDGFDASDTAYPDFKFMDPWELGSNLTGYTFHFIWRLYAIAHAVRAYDADHAARQARAEQALAVLPISHPMATQEA